MPRPRERHPTPAELEVLKVLWDRGPSTVREVLGELQPARDRAYTSVMSLLNVMTGKGLLERSQAGRAFVYRATAPRRTTLGRLVGDLLGRAFDGSASGLVAQLLDEARPQGEELDQIRSAIEGYEAHRRGDGERGAGA